MSEQHSIYFHFVFNACRRLCGAFALPATHSAMCRVIRIYCRRMWLADGLVALSQATQRAEQPIVGRVQRGDLLALCFDDALLVCQRHGHLDLLLAQLLLHVDQPVNGQMGGKQSEMSVFLSRFWWAKCNDGKCAILAASQQANPPMAGSNSLWNDVSHFNITVRWCGQVIVRVAPADVTAIFVAMLRS